MAVASAILLVLSLTLAVLFGNQTAPWTWGPALLALAAAGFSSLAILARSNSLRIRSASSWIGVAAVLWFGARALLSPVQELAQADLMLMAGCLIAFLCMHAISRDARALLVLHGGVGLLLAANLVVACIQLREPGYRPLLVNTNGIRGVTGFFSHYNYFANYLLASGTLLFAQAYGGRRHILLRISYGTLALMAYTAIWLSGSRGGLLAMMVTAGVACILITLDGHRRKERWAPVATILLPVLGAGLLLLLFYGWQQMQTARGSASGEGLSLLMDNVARLSFYSLAVSAMMSHLWTGGGSQSFSWEAYRYWEPEMGHWMNRPEFVHNEMLQAATDYGLIGFLLLSALLITLVIGGLVQMTLGPKVMNPESAALRIAGLCGLAGLVTHSCFSFVFHLIPGALFLGLFMGAVTAPDREESVKVSRRWSRATVICAMAVILLWLTATAWNASRAMAAMWPQHYAKWQSGKLTAKMPGLSQAIEAWPVAALYQLRGLAAHKLFTSGSSDKQDEYARRAARDYAIASKLNPYSPETELNLANVLSRLQRPDEAETRYQRAIELQGGLDVAFRSHYHMAKHYLNKSMMQLEEGRAEEALKSIASAAHHIESTDYWGAEIQSTRILIYDRMGVIHEANGMLGEAFKAYEKAATMYGHQRRDIYLRSAILMARVANELWLKREPSRALQRFLYAQNYVRMSYDRLPPGVSAGQRDEFVRMLDESIRKLREAGIEAEK